MITANFT